MAVQKVLLQKAEERLHGDIVPGSTGPAHRYDHGMPGNGTYVFHSSKLRSPIVIQHVSGGITTSGDRFVDALIAMRDFTRESIK